MDGRCAACGIGWAPGDVQLQVLRPSDDDPPVPLAEPMDVHFNSVCWRAVDPDADWLWEPEHGPVSILALPGPDDSPDVAIARIAVQLLSRAVQKRDQDDVGQFQRLVDEAEDLLDPVFRRIHAEESRALSIELQARQWELPPRAMETVKATLAARVAAPLKSSEDAVCWLCATTLATGDVVLLHGRAPDDYERPMCSHFHCAWRGANETGVWKDQQGTRAPRSEPFKAMVALHTYVATRRPVSPAEYTWREKGHRKALKAALGAMAEGWLRHAKKSADRLARQVQRWSRIVRERDAHAQGRAEPSGT